MIKLYQFPSIWHLPNASPFCMKLETYLRMTKLPFETVSIFNPRKGPNKKLPYIEDAGKKIADSGLIIDYLKEKYGDNLDMLLTAEDKAIALAFTRLIEEHLYWIIVYSRWADEDYWEITKKAFFGKLKEPIRTFIPIILRKKTERVLYAQGIGRLTKADIYKLGVEDLKALSAQLNQKPFLMGEAPSSIDATVYAFLASILTPPIACPLQDYAKSQPAFINYCNRMKEKFYEMPHEN